MPLLELKDISFSYKKTEVIKGLSLSVERGEFATLLGESGCGKTTVLRLISGFLNPNQGKILINGEEQNGILPNRRKIGMVFQDYALFPHLTVEQNLFYGLKLKKSFRAERNKNTELVMQTAENLGLTHLLSRFPGELSGGQQQRVALGRSLVLEPELLLMDEPLSSLDTNLRIKVREELKEIQQKLKITTVYVTHDQEEALTLSDRIAVMNGGKIIQYDTPQKIYFEPKDEFTADFAGRANILHENDRKILVRPEWINIIDGLDGDITGTIISSSFFGDRFRYKIRLTDGQKITAYANSLETELPAGRKVSVAYRHQHELMD
ncbi:MAG: ABC transporter ATP-binding protein [Treponema sp.]|nr:ABC transporter ATP-binding protein [Treponema sp.]